MTYHHGRWTSAKYAGECRGCKARIERGWAALYVPAHRRMLCQPCGQRFQARARTTELDALDAAAAGHKTTPKKED